MNVAWITGAGGLIGQYLVQSAPAQWQPRPLLRSEIDLLDFDRVHSLFQREKPALVIHAAAISKNPACDANPSLAFKVNRDLTAFLASLAKNAPFIFLSTDLVFNGTRGNYVETDPVNPLGIYPRTKADAERAVLENPLHTVLRLSLNAGHSLTGNRSFNEETVAAFKAGRALNLFEDEFRCPMPAEFTARAIWEIAGQSGIFHLCGAEKLSRFEIGKLIAANHPELDPKIIPGSLREHKGSPRAPDTSMDCAKIQRRLSFELPRFSDWARRQAPGSI